MKQAAGVEVDTVDFDSLFSSGFQMKVPEYQRNYVWDEEKAGQLLTDLEEFFSEPNAPDYYLGSILLFHDRETTIHEIIDGQQRITTILLMKQCLIGPLPEHQNMHVYAGRSITNAKTVFDYFKRQKARLEALRGDLWSHLVFTRIITTRIDDAFTFFDTQNSRGVGLGPTDFLKAYHLRSIDSEPLQKECAEQWEEAAERKSNDPFLDVFFATILWRARNWTGHQLAFEEEKTILRTFQKETLDSGGSSTYPLYPSAANMGFKAAIRERPARFEPAQTPSLDESASLPLSLRQPIHSGLNFFDYTRKYTAIRALLFDDEMPADHEISRMRQLYDRIYGYDMVRFLQQWMQLCLVMYYDRFGTDRMCVAACHFDYMIGSKRLGLASVKRKSVTKYLNDSQRNVLDVIHGAYRPEEVFAFITSQKGLAEPYQKDLSSLGNGVQGRYLDRLMRFYGISDPKALLNRLQGLNQCLP